MNAVVQWGVRYPLQKGGPLDRVLQEEDRTSAERFHDSLRTRGIEAELVTRTIPEWHRA